MQKTKNLQIRKTFPSIFLLIDTIVWFSLLWFILQNYMSNAPFNDLLIVAVAYFGGVLASAFIGATLLNEKLKGKMALLSWVSLGVASCVLSGVIAYQTTSVYLVLSSLFVGVLAGLGIPTCLALFSEDTTPGNRGRSGAIVFFASQILTVLIYVFISNVNLDYEFLALAGWRFLGLLSILLWFPLEKTVENRESRRENGFSDIIRERVVYLYLIPWVLLTIVNFVEEPLIQHHFGATQYNLYQIIDILITSFSAFVGGAICDFKGRKISGILGFVMLGVGYTFLSVFSGYQIAQILWVIFDGVAWGFLYVTFIFVIWGDISEGKIKERYYFLGGMPFLLSNLISVFAQPFIESVAITDAFSLASFFLFMAIVPQLFAPETLPEKMMKDRDLKSYAEKALKQAAKEAEKNNKNADKPEKETKENTEAGQSSSYDDEARKLAEKYY